MTYRHPKCVRLYILEDVHLLASTFCEKQIECINEIISEIIIAVIQFTDMIYELNAGVSIVNQEKN